jgi:protein-S-isoprenylcysteine O-methyltransferase Ste14
VPPAAHGILIATAVIWLALEVRQSFRHRPEGVKASWSGEIVFRLVVGIGILASVLFLRRARGAAIAPAAVAAWIGLCLMWCGVALRLWSFRTLGRYFTFVVQTSGDQPVITNGPYRAIRHPSYAGLLLAVMGVGLFLGNWLSFASLTVAWAAGLVYRIRIEEKALLGNLGADYRAYAATHKRLVPFVW